MYANLMLMEAKTEAAINTYIQLLEKDPANFNTLSQLIELLRRAGRIQDIGQYVERAEKSCQRINLAGLYYCKGLQKRYEGDPAGALKELNWARFDNVYGRSAIMNMIEIYLNPSNEMIFSSQGETGYTSSPDNIAQAKILIVELQARGVETTIIECNTHICSKDGKELSSAETKLKKILEKNNNYVPALVAMALCKSIQKKPNDAKNFLKSVT